MFLAECGCCPPDPPKRYTCTDGSCVEDPNGEYDEPTCGGNCELPCICTDTCSYFIELVEPSALAVKSPYYRCGYGTQTVSVTIDSLLEDLTAAMGMPSFSAVDSESSAVAFNNGGSFGVNVSHALRGFQGDIPEAGNQFGAQSSANIAFFCSYGENGELTYKAQVSLYATALFFIESLGFTTIGYWGRGFYGEFEVPSSCISDSDRTCYGWAGETPHITTPLTVTFSGDGTCSLGALDMTQDSGDAVVPPDFPYARDAVDAILDGISYEVTITSTPSCADPCSVLIDGERVPVSSFNPYEVINATWRGRQVPGRNKTIVDGEVLSDFDTPSNDQLLIITTAGCDGGSQTNDYLGLLIAPDGSGIINPCITYEAANKHATLACEAVDGTTARLYGGITTEKVYTPCVIDGAPSGDSVQEAKWWEWECFVVDGVPGEVTVSPAGVSVRTLNNDPFVCGAATHEAPVVTLTFIP